MTCRLTFRRLCAALFGAAAIVALPFAAHAQLPATATLDAATTQTGRVLRNGVSSACGAFKGFPSLNDSTPGRAYDAYTFTNASASPRCYLVTTTSGGTALFTVAYLGPFNSASLSTNYLGDPGQSNTTTSFGVDVPAGATVTVVVHEVNVGGGVGQSYTVDSQPFVTIPTLSEWAMIAMALSLLTTAVVTLRRRRTSGAATDAGETSP